MLETSFGINFFLKTPHKPNKIRSIYVRISVDGTIQETSTKRKWHIDRWDHKTDRALGTKEDARIINAFLDSMINKITNYRTVLLNKEETVTTQKIIDCIKGKVVERKKVLEEFKLHNDEIFELVPKEYSMATHERYVTARSHVAEFIKFRYGREDLEFRELNCEFAMDYEFYLKTVRKNSKNTALKYISNFKKIILRAIDKKIISEDPFSSFKSKRVKVKKKPLTRHELEVLEKHRFDNERLAIVRDIFVFQCYTGLAYIDSFQLKKSEIKLGENGEWCIHSARQKTDSETYIPLLPRAAAILEKYKDHPICVARGTVLPVRSNQKMNGYLKEIADIVGFAFPLNTHKARRTFGSTVTLNNDVPINVVKEMLGHSSVKQTEEYAITEQSTISRNMATLKAKLESKSDMKTGISALRKIQIELHDLKYRLALAQKEQEQDDDRDNLILDIAAEMAELQEDLKAILIN